MKLTIKRNGIEIEPSKMLKQLAGSVEGTKSYLLETLEMAANEAQSIMILAFEGDEEYGTLPEAGNFVGFNRDSYTGADGSPQRKDSGTLISSLEVWHKRNNTSFMFCAGAKNAPQYFFAQDEGWKKANMPDGAAWEYVHGTNARKHGIDAARAVIEQRLADAGAIEQSLREGGLWDAVYGEMPF
jgi:hypothetical protein